LPFASKNEILNATVPFSCLSLSIAPATALSMLTLSTGTILKVVPAGNAPSGALTSTVTPLYS